LKYIEALCSIFEADYKKVLQNMNLNPDLKQAKMAMRTHPFVMRENYASEDTR